MANKEEKAIKSGFWYTISSISVKAILIFTTPIFTRLMTTSDYGLAATFTTWFSLLNIVCSLNLWYSIGRAKIDFTEKFDEFVGSIQLLALMFTLLLESISLIFFDEVCSLLELNGPLVIALYIYLLFYPAVQLTQAKFKYLYNYKGNIAITVYTTVATVALSLLFVVVLPNNMALGKSLGAVVSTVILGSVFWAITIKNKNININVEYWKYALAISAPLILNSISLNILAQSDRVFITKLCGSHYTGIYSLAYSYAVLINIVLNSVNEAWLPWFHDTYHLEEYWKIKKYVRPLVVFGCWFGIGCVAIAPEAIMILGGKTYYDGVWVVAPVTLGLVCNYIFQHYEHIELHLKKTWYISMGTIIAAALNIVLNAIFVKKFGFIAAAYTTLVCYLMLMVLHNIISRCILKIHLYSDKFMYAAFIITAGISAVFMALYKYHWIYRWVLIVLVSVGYLVVNRKYIVKVIERFKQKRSK